MTEGTYRTEVSASSELSGVYIGPLIRHCLRGPRVQALRVPYSHGYSRVPPPFKDSPITSGPLLYFRDDYCAPGCWLLSSSVQPCPLQVRNCTVTNRLVAAGEIDPSVGKEGPNNIVVLQELSS